MYLLFCSIVPRTDPPTAWVGGPTNLQPRSGIGRRERIFNCRVSVCPYIDYYNKGSTLQAFFHIFFFCFAFFFDKWGNLFFFSFSIAIYNACLGDAG